jgi:hypothetical protein
MPDVYATIAEVDAATQERLADILELRAADEQQCAMLDSSRPRAAGRTRRGLPRTSSGRDLGGLRRGLRDDHRGAR